MKEAAQGENWKRDSARAGRKGKNNARESARKQSPEWAIYFFLYSFLPRV